MREYDVVAADGTWLRGWRSDGHGPPVLLCAGLGPAAETWPALARYPTLNGDAPPSRRASTSIPVISWYHRGTTGSRRPADETRIGLEDHVADAISVLDEAGVRRCVVMGWSIGVMVATELARRYPSRVSGLLLVAGVPGDPFGAMLGLPGLPTGLRRTIARSGAHTLKAAAPLVDAVLHRVPAEVAEAMRRFLKIDWGWYATLALAVGSVPARDLRGLTCPVTVLAGRYDLLSDPASVLRPVSGLPQARTRILATTHFMPLQQPAVLSEELTLLVERVAAVERARAELRAERKPIDELIPPLTYDSRRPGKWGCDPRRRGRS